MIDLNNIAKQSLKIAEHRKLETDALSCIKHCAGEIAEATQAIDNYQSCVCEETERKCLMIEMSENYCDVIRRRYTKWAKENGKPITSGCLE